MMAGAVAFGVGFLVAAAFPPSRAEEQLAEQAMDKAEPLKQQLMESGQEVAEHLKESATEAVEPGQADGDGGAGQVADTAKEAAQTPRSDERRRPAGTGWSWLDVTASEDGPALIGSAGSSQ